MQRSVRSVPVVVLDVLAQYDVEVAWSGDQEVVEAFPAQGADEAFRDRIRPGCPDRRLDDPHVGGGEPGIDPTTLKVREGAAQLRAGVGERANPTSSQTIRS